ncbi:hypothetical protein [Lysinibacter sp. HNR]|nr:hypothetical protein [Lysinibacter sp. HNR]WGD36514.1 hypothetical protein FrondiHNR_08505 [Lysinibacter sp. HNR]
MKRAQQSRELGESYYQVMSDNFFYEPGLGSIPLVSAVRTLRRMDHR